ncbi:hypothetical protein [Embleya scabrispora]|uniref:hypothetical protein n=1 Tax=Embleya scabrispora TaxID=159449 RepID=UPI001374C375|nr:hypothetical protein [Embleya scabrispora]
MNRASGTSYNTPRCGVSTTPGRPNARTTPGTPVGFVRRLDQVAVAAPHSVERRITG